MSNIEPTEEQRRAVKAVLGCDDADFCEGALSLDVARLLAEREAKLREELSEANAEFNALRKSMMQADACIENFIANEDKADALLKRAGLDDTVNVVPRLAALVDETVALRARVAGLERLDLDRDRALYLAEGEYFAASAREAQHLARIAELEAEVAIKDEERTMQVSMIQSLRNAREAQHLADIKALLRSCCVAMDAIDDGDSVAARNELAEATERLAHYDDAKAAEGGEA